MKKQQAIKLRRQGLTYNQINQKLNIPKSTLAYWFKELPENKKIKIKNYTLAQKTWSAILIKYNIEKAKKIKEKNKRVQLVAAKTINKINEKNLKLIGIALYWAEGYKKSRWNLTFSNSDPLMIKLMMAFFIKICAVPMERIKGQVQIHPNISQSQAEKYWQQVSKIPQSQFRKPLIALSKSSHQHRNPHTLPFGTFRIIINDVHTVNLIQGWIKGIAQQFNH